MFRKTITAPVQLYRIAVEARGVNFGNGQWDDQPKERDVWLVGADERPERLATVLRRAQERALGERERVDRTDVEIRVTLTSEPIALADLLDDSGKPGVVWETEGT